MRGRKNIGNSLQTRMVYAEWSLAHGGCCGKMECYLKEEEDSSFVLPRFSKESHFELSLSYWQMLSTGSIDNSMRGASQS